MKKHRNKKSQQGVALVVTVIVVAMLAVVAVAMMQSTSIDRLSSRSVANYYRAQLAAQSGVAAAMSTIGFAITNGRSGRAQWGYVSGHLNAEPQGVGSAVNAEANAFAFIGQIDAASGALLNTTFLNSTSDDGSNALIPISSAKTEPAYPGQWVNIYATNSSGASNVIARYAFWVSDDTTKLNPQVMGSAASRKFSADPSNIRLTVRESAGSRGSATVVPPNIVGPFISQTNYDDLSHWDGSPANRTAAFPFITPGTFKLAIGAALAPDQSLENDMTVESLSAPIAPNGKPKINLTRLKAFLDSLPKNQSAQNLRYKAVLDILDASKSDEHKKWGGGELSFLLNDSVMDGKYTQTEARQFVANLFDVLDEDFIPTCDNSDNPTVLGVEMRDTPNGLQGHPFIVFVGTGHYASPQLANGTTRVRTHLALGFANPWPTASEPWANYSLDISVTPSDPQFPTLTAENAEQLTSKPSAVGSSLPQRSAFLFPCGSASQPHYSAPRDLQGEIQQVNNLTFTVNRARLIYKSTEGDYLVALVPGAPTLEALPSTVPKGGDGQNRLAWQPNRQSYWLRSDPRLHIDSSRWATVANGSGGANSGVIPGPQSAINYMLSPTEGDGAQGLSGTITPGMTSASGDQWYRSASITNHLSMDDSLSFEGNQTRIASAGFLGFVNVGKPWQTLTLHNSNSNNPEGSEDWKIFDYVYAGEDIRAGNAVLHANMAPSGNSPYGPNGQRADWPGAISQDGSINSMNGNWNTWRGLLEGIAGVDADDLASQLAEGSSQAYDNTFQFLRSVDLGSGANTDFARERPIRLIADALTSRSRSFTVYAIGESLSPSAPGQPVKVASRASAKARLRIDLDENSGGISVRLLETTSF